MELKSLKRAGHCIVTAATVFLLGLAVVPPVVAQRSAATNFQVGDAIEVLWAGDAFPGKVVKVERGFVTVNYEWNGRPWTERYGVNSGKVRKVQGAARTAAGRGAAPTRKWTDSTGKFEIEASFVSKDDSGVKLKKSDGQTISIPVAKLSKEDQAYLEGYLASVGGDNPFQPVEDGGSSGELANDYDREAGYSQMETILPQPIDQQNFTPDAAGQVAAPASNKAVALSTGGRGQEKFFESPRGLVISPGKGEAMVVYVNAPPGGEREVTVVRVDMKTMKVIGQAAAVSNATPVDVSPSGNLLACLPDWTARNGRDAEMIEIVQLNGKELKPVRRWNMGEHSEWDKRFEQLFFIGESKLLTTSAWGGNVTLWDINKAQAIWQMKVTGHHTPALSANRKQFAAMIDGGVGVFDAATGDTLARLTAEGAHGGVLSFSPDGERLACVTARVLRVWELASGEMVNEVWFPKQMSAKSLDWVNDGMVMVDHVYLVDMTKRIVLWQYELPSIRADTIAQMAGGRYWVVGGGHNAPYQLACLTVPDSAAKQKGETLTAESVLAVKPGAAVSVRINLPSASPEELQKVTKVLVDEIKANGLELAAGAPVVIECSITDGGAETVTYSRFGFGRGGGEQATVSKQVSVLSIKENGKEVWVATGAYGAPFSVHQKDGQSIQDAVNAQKGNPVQFFLHAKLPKHVARHEADGTYGKSRLQP